MQQEHQSRFNPSLSVTEVRQNTKTKFHQYFSQQGYEEQTAAPLIANQDQSLLFTNSTIASMKSYILNPSAIPPTGIVQTQPCVRVQNLKDIYKESYEPNYLCHFDMLGVLTNAYRFEEINREVLGFLNAQGVSDQQVVIELSSNDKDFATIWKTLLPQAQILIDTQEDSFYRWQFGFNNVSGRGITFSIIPPGKETLDRIAVGNVIAIAVDSQEVCIELALGIETLLMGQHQLDRCVDISLIGQVIPGRTKPEIILADVLSVSFALYDEGLRPGNKKDQHVLKRLLKTIDYFSREPENQCYNIEDLLVQYAELQDQPQDSTIRDLLKDLNILKDRYLQNQTRFLKSLKKNARNSKTPSHEQINTIVAKAKDTFGLHPRDALKAIGEAYGT